MTKNKNWPIIAGAIWSFVFAIMSFYWALGGMIGVESLGGKIYQLALERNPQFILLVWITGFIKVIGGVFLLLMLMNRLPDFIKKSLYWISIVAGIFLFLYGAANFTTVGMAKWGLLEMGQQSQIGGFIFGSPFGCLVEFFILLQAGGQVKSFLLVIHPK
ncbi:MULTISPECIES: DUF3995 domain-containing protein [Bacillus]|uniref:DUF3995 domain-containing protein n=1 Tax=Bacillus capparidis TaxID=1840411 RepID=A0ABS4CRT5_9BACI|nr:MULTISPECIES: DUF3995 domain-containing protein [Bacillus]MBP1080286.1 hypothetical protein [Bacillus capparidis]MED1094151.1 DUF3995 domain-containing protein [Bacillus capparidis]